MSKRVARPAVPVEEQDRSSGPGAARSEEAPVLVVGLGEVGRPLLDILGTAHRAAGRDLEDRPFHGVGILHLCYPFGAGFVPSAAGYVSQYQPEVVVVNSTVTPGTSSAIEEATGVPTVYSPVRGKHTRMKEELLRYRKFLAGTDLEAVTRVEDHFRAAGMATQRMSSFEVLELAKLLETSYFGVLLAWAQEMDRYTTAVGADYAEALRFVEEIDFLPPVTFQPGHIGGHCVMPNLDLLEEVRSSPFIDAIRRSNADRATEWRAAGRSLDVRLSPIAREGRAEDMSERAAAAEDPPARSPALSCQIQSVPLMSEGTVSMGRLGARKRTRLFLRRVFPAPFKRRLKKGLQRIRPARPASVRLPSTAAMPPLDAGALVRIRSREEISATLDMWQQLKGCGFIPEMTAYCGTVQRVLKPVHRFVDERDYRVKRVSGMYLLEGVMCEGTATFGRCDRGCLYFWREEWLEPVGEVGGKPAGASGSHAQMTPIGGNHASGGAPAGARDLS